MALRNAFEELGTEGTLRKILRAVQFAKDSADRMQVVVSNQATVSVVAANQGNSLNGLGVAPYAPTAWNAHDVRAEYQELSHQSFQSGPRVRWTIS